MIDVSQIKYRVVVHDKGKQYEIQDFITDLGWEENEKELASRISFTAYNMKTSAGYISSIVKLGVLIVIYASSGGKDQEVARGYVTNWNPVLTGGTQKITIHCYDDLYSFQQSQDSVYFPAGISTKSIITKLLDSWGIKLGKYNGPDVTHSKLKYQAKNLSDILLDVLTQAKKKGAENCFMRATQGKIDIIPYGNNDAVYSFESKNTMSVNHSLSTADIVTAVKVIGQTEDDKRDKVEAVLKGQVAKYGLRQKIVTTSKNDKLADAKAEAQEILNEQGKVKSDITVQLPNVPYVRKGNTINIKSGTLDGDYYVMSIRHEADAGTMTLTLKKSDAVKVSENNVTESKNHKVGDIVTYNGGSHYLASDKCAKGYDAAKGKAKITIIKPGTTHPYHLVHMDTQSNVYGWVDLDTFT